MGCGCKSGLSKSSRNIVKRTAPTNTARSSSSRGRIIKRIIK